VETVRDLKTSDEWHIKLLQTRGNVSVLKMSFCTQSDRHKMPTAAIVLRHCG